MSLLPTDLENIIIDYKLGLESYLAQKARMIECNKEIEKIEHSYQLINYEDEDSEFLQTTVVIKNNIETIYYIHKEFDEIESSYIGSHMSLKYYCFENNKLTDFSDNS